MKWGIRDSTMDAISSSRNDFHIHGGHSVLLWGEVVSFTISGPPTRHQEMIRGIQSDGKLQEVLVCIISSLLFKLTSRCSRAGSPSLAYLLTLWLGKSVGEMESMIFLGFEEPMAIARPNTVLSEVDPI